MALLLFNWKRQFKSEMLYNINFKKPLQFSRSFKIKFYSILSHCYHLQYTTTVKNNVLRLRNILVMSQLNSTAHSLYICRSFIFINFVKRTGKNFQFLNYYLFCILHYWANSFCFSFLALYGPGWFVKGTWLNLTSSAYA